MAEVILPELFLGGAAEFAGAEAVGFGAAEAFGGAEAAFGAGEAFGGAELAGAASVDALGEAGLGAIGSAGLEAGSGALEALGGFGFDAPLSTEALGSGVGEFSGSGITGGELSGELTAQGGFIPASNVETLGTDAISALNEPTLGTPDIAGQAAETPGLGSVESGTTEGGGLLTEPSGVTAPEATGNIAEARPEASMGGDTGEGSIAKMAGSEPTPAEQAGQQVGSGAGRGAGAAGTGGTGAGAGGAGGMNPMQALSQLAKLMQPQPQSPYLPRGAGYAGSLGDFGQKQIDQYNSGQLRPEDLSTLMLKQRASLNKMRQFYAQSGNSNSTAARQAEQKILQDSVADQVQFFNQYLSSGMSSLGTASNAMLNASRIDLQNQQSYNKSQSDALSGLTKILSGGTGSGGSGAGGNPPAQIANNSTGGGDYGGGYGGDYGGGDTSAADLGVG